MTTRAMEKWSQKSVRAGLILNSCLLTIHGLIFCLLCFIQVALSMQLSHCCCHLSVNEFIRFIKPQHT